MDNASLQLFRLFRVLMEERSVSRAARRAGLSQPATSHALGRLRRLFGDDLLIPSPKGMVSTPRALEINRELESVLERFDRLVSPPELFRPDQSRRRFIVSAAEYAEFILLPKLMAEIRKVAPRIEIEIRIPDQELLPAWLESGEVDVRIAWLRRPTPSLKSRSLFYDELVCIACRQHRDIESPLTLERYLSLPHARHSLIGRTTIGQTIDEAARTMGGKLNLTLNVPNFLTIPYIVAGSDIIATLPRRMAVAFTAHLPLQILAIPMPLPRIRYCAYWHSRSHADPGHKWFRQQLARVAGSLKS